MDSTTARSMHVLGTLARDGGPMRLTAIAAETSLGKSVVHRLLSTLVELGFVAQDEESGYYCATLKIWEWGLSIVSSHPAKRATAPYLEELHRLTSETVNLLVLDGDEVLFVEKIRSPRLLRYSTQPGSRAPAVLTASGKAMLAHTPEAEKIIVHSIATMERANHLTLEGVMKELEQVRKVGYAYSDQTWAHGIISFAAPVMGRNGKPAAAISVTAPKDRISPEQQVAIVDALLYTCSRIFQNVGLI